MALGRIRRQRQPVTIVTYHSVGTEPDPYTVSTAAFERQIGALRAAYPVRPITDVPTMLNNGLPGRQIVVTFDDALVDFYEHAYPVLEALTISTTVFVPTAYIGKFNEWDAGRPGYVRKPVMTEAQLRELAAVGLVRIGSHSVTHARMSRLSPAGMREEASASRKRLEDMLAIPVTAFAYPYGQLGDFSEPTTDALAAAGYDIAVTTRWGTTNCARDVLRLRRIFFTERDGGRAARRKACGWHEWRALKEWAGHTLRSMARAQPRADRPSTAA